MKNNLFSKQIKIENNYRNKSMNERYHKKNFILINSSNTKTLSTFSTLRKIEDLKRKYNHMNFQQKQNLRNTFNKILNLKKKYNSKDTYKSKTIETEKNYNNKLNSKKTFLIQSTDRLSLINPNFEKDSNSNLYLHTDRDIKDYYSITDNNKLKKSNEINYQIKPNTTKFNHNKNNKLNIKILKNFSEKNNKTIREELLKFGKNIKSFLKENDFNDENKEINDNGYFIDKNKQRNKSVCPIKERINKLTSVKNKIKKINKDLFKENEKNNNSNVSQDSQVALEFKHIKPKIMKDNSIEEYFIEEQKIKYTNDNLLKPVLIRSLPRPKLNIPKYSFFGKTS